MVFASREDAGRKLAQFLEDRGVTADMVLGLPRGGVVVASEVARFLGLPLDVLLVRKIGHPLQREFAVGALAEGGVVTLDKHLLGGNPVIQGLLDGVVTEETQRLEEYQSRFHPFGPCGLAGKAVMLVDDGLATGSTTEAAVLSARKRRAARAVVAVPVASSSGVDRLEKVADGVYALWVDPVFEAVGRYYESFAQTTDEQVMRLLRAA